MSEILTRSEVYGFASLPPREGISVGRLSAPDGQSIIVITIRNGDGFALTCPLDPGAFAEFAGNLGAAIEEANAIARARAAA